MDIKIPKERECGDCQACCIAPYIDDPELKKGAFEDCRNLCETGCSIYQNRPQTCRAFECGWLLGAMDDDWRPDKSGIMLTCNDPFGKRSIFAWEVKRNASNSARIRKGLAKLRDAMQMTVIIYEYGLPVLDNWLIHEDKLVKIDDNIYKLTCAAAKAGMPMT